MNSLAIQRKYLGSHPHPQPAEHADGWDRRDLAAVPETHALRDEESSLRRSTYGSIVKWRMGRRGALTMIIFMESSVSLEHLSPAQREFASREEATPGPRGAVSGVFLYREELQATYRWLVSREGYVLDSARFGRA